MNDYHNLHTQQKGGMTIVREISIKNGRGYKRTAFYNKNRLDSSGKKPLTRKEIRRIERGEFVPGIFRNITLKHRTMKHRTMKYRKKK